MIKAGIFDVGGVLHDNSAPHIFLDIKTTLGIDNKTLRSAWYKPMQLLAKGSISEKDFWRIFTQKAKATKPLPQESLLLRSYIKHYGRHDEVFSLVKNLKRRGLKVAVLSNTIQPHADYQRRIGIYQLFDTVVLSHEIGITKPNPKIYHITLKKLSIKPAEAFVVDDEARYVEAANKLGIQGILYQNANQLVHDLEHLGIVI